MRVDEAQSAAIEAIVPRAAVAFFSCSPTRGAVAVDPMPFVVGPVSHAAARVLAGFTLAYAAASGYYTWRAYQSKLEDRGSALVATLVMFALAVVLWRDGARLMPAPFSIWLLAMAALGIVITLTYTLGHYEEKIARFRAAFGARLNALLADVLPEDREAFLRSVRDRWIPKGEGRRKAPHLLLGLVIPLYAGVGFILLRMAWNLSYGGMPDPAAEGSTNLYLASHSGWLAGGQVFGSFVLLAILFLIFPNELLRLRFPELSYPFKTVILSRLRHREHGLFGAHYYIAAASPLAALWVTRDSSAWDTTVYAFIAVLAVSVFADTASALVGIRFGRRKWFHNPNKSYIGSIGGVLVALFVAWPLVGLPMAVVTAGVFLLVDVLAPVPISVSDNLLNPLALAATYTLLQGGLAPILPYY